MSGRTVRLQDAAREDLRGGRRFYENLQQGVGTWFWDSLVADMESLHVYAGLHVRQFGFYRMLAKRFPYAIYYDLDDEFITIVAVLPLRRDPAWAAAQSAGRSVGP